MFVFTETAVLPAAITHVTREARSSEQKTGRWRYQLVTSFSGETNKQILLNFLINAVKIHQNIFII